MWALITTFQYWPVWMVDVAAVRWITTSQAQAGTRFELMRVRALDPENWIVAEYEAGQKLRLAEYHQRIQLNLAVEPTATGTLLRTQLEWPNTRGLLGRFLPDMARGQALERSLARLKEVFDLNQDIKLLHGMGDE